MPYLLDTNICVFYLRGVPSIRQKLHDIGREACVISEVVIFELRFGAENSADPAVGHQLIDDFLEGLEVVPIANVVMRYAKEKTRLRKLGTPLHDEFDLIIGVTAVEHDYTLVTDNTKHFNRIENIQLENWLPR